MAGKSMIAVGLALFLAGCAVRPEALTEEDIAAFTAENLSTLTSQQEPIRGPVSMYEAMARALKYNLDYRVEQMKEALAISEAALSNWDMLPKVVASSEWSRRSNEPGGRSQSLLTGITSLEPSKSTEKTTLTADLEFSWNILDFGLSWVRAKQAADKVLIAMERRRKVVNRIIEDVRSAFWKAASHQRLAGSMKRLSQRVRRALVHARRMARDGETTPLSALTYERELVNIRKQLRALQAELSVAKVQLAALMNVAPGTSFTLAIPRQRKARLNLDLAPERMIAIALKNRPELREAAYRQLINAREAQAALFELLPGLTPYAALNADANDFLYNNNWVSWGARASWNLMRLFRYPARKRAIENRNALLKEQAKALTMAVMTQVYISRIRYLQQRRIFDAAREYLDVQRRILRQVRAASAADAASEQTLIREQMNTILAAARYDVAYAGLQNAIANVYASLGLDPIPAEDIDSLPVKALAQRLRAAWNRRNVAAPSG